VYVATGFDIRPRLEIFLYTTASRPALWHTHPLTQRLPVVLSLGVKRQGREADHSPPSSVEVMNGGAILTLPHMPS
jgi:hypothetical protein